MIGIVEDLGESFRYAASAEGFAIIVSDSIGRKRPNAA